MAPFGIVLDSAAGELADTDGVASVDCGLDDWACAVANARDKPNVAKIVVARLRVLFMINSLSR